MFRRILILSGLVASFFTGVLVTRNWPAKASDAPHVAANIIPAPEAEKKSTPAPEPPPAPLPPPPTEIDPRPTPAEFPEIIDLLRSGYLESPALAGTPLTAETLPGVLEKARDKIRISDSPTQVPVAGAKTLAEMLPGGSAYWRPRSFNTSELDRLVKEWSFWKSAKPNGIIIDLRFFADANNFAGAAPATGLFLSPGRNLFTLQSLNQPQHLFKSERQPLDIPSWMPVFVLVNRETRGAAEALAWALRHEAGAILVGQATAGEGGLFRETRLKSGRFLRLATARALASDGTDLLASGISPDILAEVPLVDERTAFASAYRSGAASLLAEPEPLPRLNQDISSQVLNAEADKSPKPPLSDPALKAALDGIAAIQVRRQNPPSAPTP